MSGLFQRIDYARKHAFGVMSILQASRRQPPSAQAALEPLVWAAVGAAVLRCRLRRQLRPQLLTRVLGWRRGCAEAAKALLAEAGGSAVMNTDSQSVYN